MTFLSLTWYISLSILFGIMAQTILKNIRRRLANQTIDNWTIERQDKFKKLKKKWFKPLYFPWPVYDIADLMYPNSPASKQVWRNAKIISLMHSHNEFLQTLDKHSVDIKSIFNDKPFTFESMKKGTLVRYISPILWKHEDFDQFISSNRLNYIRSGFRYKSDEYFVPMDGYHWIIGCPQNFIDNGLPNSITLYSLCERTSPYYSDQMDAHRREMKLGTIGLFLGPILVKWRGIYENADILDEECGIVLFDNKYYIVTQECIELVQ